LLLLGACIEFQAEGRPDFVGEGDEFSIDGIVRGVDVDEGKLEIEVTDVHYADGEAEDRLDEGKKVDFFDEYRGEVENDGDTGCKDIPSNPEIAWPDGGSWELGDLAGMRVEVEGKTVDTVSGGNCAGHLRTKQRELFAEVDIKPMNSGR